MKPLLGISVLNSPEAEIPCTDLGDSIQKLSEVPMQLRALKSSPLAGINFTNPVHNLSNLYKESQWKSWVYRED